MALFSTKTGAKRAPRKTQASAKQKKSVDRVFTKEPGRILKAPRMTEKAVYMTLVNAYVFEVAPDATKRDIVAAIEALFQVTPRRVTVVCKQPRAFVARMRNRRGTKAGMKKAYVFLKKGDKIDLK